MTRAASMSTRAGRFVAVVATGVLTATAFAQDSAGAGTPDFSGIEEIVVVVGSRARSESRADDLPVGVDVFQGTDLERAGEVDLGAALTKLAPSFNYSRLSVGDGAAHSAATLRGLAPDQTLVLVNGKRRHGIAWLRVLDGVIGYGTGGTDLRSLPASALARIEVLRDGAAAQYGSDAIAGVLNLVLRDEAEGGEVTVYGGEGGGDGSSQSVSFHGGLPLGAEGFLHVSGEWHDENPLRRNGGNGGHDPNYQDELITTSSPGVKGRSLFVNAGLPVGDAELYAFGGVSRRESRSSGAYRFRYNYWEGLDSGDPTWDFVLPNFVNFHERNTHPVYPDGFLPYEETRIDDVSFAAGMRRTLGDWDLDVSAAYGRNEFGFGVSGSINASVGAHYLDRNPGASVADIVANAGPLSGDSGGIEFDQLTVNLDVRRAFEDSVLTALAAGLEHRHEGYAQIAGDEAAWSCGLPHADDYGAFAVGPDGAPLTGIVAACGFQGYPGYSPRNAQLSDDSRKSQAAYVELETQPLPALSVAFALRAENYSDAGSQTTGKVAGHLRIAPGLALRAAASTGFRAPSLAQRRFNSILFVGSQEGLTTVLAANEGHSIPRAFGVDALEHETAENWSAGLVYTAGDNFRVTLDVYQTDIEERVVRSRGLGCAGVPVCDSERVSTAAFFFNGVDTETRGADLAARWGVPAAGGYLWLSANANASKTEIAGERLPAGAPAGLTFADYFGGWAADTLERGQPRRQGNFTADWERGTFGLLLRANHYGKTTQHPLDTGMVTIDAATTVDIEARLRMGAVRAAVGVNNVGDELPTELGKTHLSNVLWGIRYPVDTPFGLAGRVTYLRVSWGWGS